MKIKGRKIVITGASSGIGALLCHMLAPDNSIVAVARNTSKIPVHENIIPQSCDVSIEAHINNMFGFALEKLGGIDIFFANAGFTYYGRIKNADWNDLARIYNTNVLSVIYSLQKMREIKGSAPFSFVITASAMSFLNLPGYALYGSTKFALKGFSDAVRYELHKGQNLHMVYPIATRTSFFDAAHITQLPWPRMKAETVARRIIAGVSRNHKHIYPSFLFRLLLFFNRFLPAFRTYNYFEMKKFSAQNPKPHA